MCAVFTATFNKTHSKIQNLTDKRNAYFATVNQKFGGSSQLLTMFRQQNSAWQ